MWQSYEKVMTMQKESKFFFFLCLYAKFYIPLHWIIHKEEDERIQK